jgi:hypothetical protein
MADPTGNNSVLTASTAGIVNGAPTGDNTVLPGTSAPPASYVGPGDLVASASMWWGLRGYSAAYAAPGNNPAMDVLRASDSTTITINVLANGNLDVATLTTFLAATTGTCSKLYDQTGNGNHVVQPTAANQPAVVLNALGALPCLNFSNSSATMSASGNFTPATGVVSLSTVANRTTGTAAFVFAGENAGGAAAGNRIIANAAANVWRIVGGTSGFVARTSVADGSWHAGNGVITGTSSVLNVDGTEATNTATGSTTTAAPLVGLTQGTVTAEMTEGGAWDNVAFTGTQRTALNSNQHAYWGF